MTAKVNKGSKGKANPVANELIQTQYARNEHSNPIVDSVIQTQYARVMDNMSELKLVMRDIDSMIKESFPNASEDARLQLLTKLLDKL